MPKQSEFVYFTGKGMWVRPDVTDKWGKVKHVMYPNKESLDKFFALKKGDQEKNIKGIMNVLRKDEAGEYNFTISTPITKEFKGIITPLAKPQLFDAQNQPLKNVFIGNGSDITTKCTLYSYNVKGGGKGWAIRWHSTRVDILVPYEGKRDLQGFEREAVEGLIDQPVQTNDPGF